MNKDKHFIKIIILFILILLVIILFLSRVFYLSTHKPPHFISTSTISKDLALRGKIISKDNYILAQDKKNLFSCYNRKIYQSYKKRAFNKFTFNIYK